MHGSMSSSQRLKKVLRHSLSMAQLFEPKQRPHPAALPAKNGYSPADGSVQPIQEQHPDSPRSACSGNDPAEHDISHCAHVLRLDNNDLATEIGAIDLHSFTPKYGRPQTTTVSVEPQCGPFLEGEFLTSGRYQQRYGDIVRMPATINQSNEKLIVSQHSAIPNKPPLLARHSEPVLRQCEAHDHNEAERSDSAVHLRWQCSTMSLEREKLVDQSEVTTGELAEAYDQLGQLREELNICEGVYIEQSKRHHLWSDRLQEMKEELSLARTQSCKIHRSTGQCLQRDHKMLLNVRALFKSNTRCIRWMKQRLGDVKPASSNTESRASQCSNAVASSNAGHDAVRAELHRVMQQRNRALCHVDAQRREIEILRQKLIEQSSESEDLKLAQQEVYDLHQRVHDMKAAMSGTQLELETVTAELFVVNKQSQDQTREISSMRHRLVENVAMRDTM